MKNRSRRPAFDAVRIAKVRADLDMTQAEFGDLVGVSRQTVHAWESGRHPVTPMRAYQLDNELKRRASSMTIVRA